MDIAIRVQQISLGEERYVYKPIGIIKGIYDSDNDYFLDEYGYEFYGMESGTTYGERFFCCPTNIEELKNTYSNLKEEQILEEFLSNFMELCFVGYYDPISNGMKLIEINFGDLEESFAKKDNDFDEEQESVIEFDVENNERFVFDLQTLKEIKEYQTVEEIRNFIDNLIVAGEYIKSVSKEKTEESSKNQYSLKQEESKQFNLKEMRNFVFSEIVAQDEAVKRITTRILTNFKSSDYRRKSHLLIMGGTGTGKSKTIELICQYLNIPFAKVDANNYTQTGYVGRSVDEMLLKLIYAANGDIELAQKGILVIDEIDKKAPNGDSSGVSTKSVLDTLLQITGRGTVEVDLVEDRCKRTIDFDTSNLTVILTGAFEGIEKYGNKEEHKTIGFVNNTETKKEEVEITPQMLIKYGMTPELMGRIKCIVPLKKFEEDDYVKILRYSKSSPLQVEKYYLETDEGIKLTYTANYLKEIARQAKKLDQGARGADVAVARSLEDIHERVLNGEPIKELKLTKRTALNNKEYYVKY